MRVDAMSKMRGVDVFSLLWKRRTTIALPDGTRCDLMSLPDLVQAKKTQRNKDWPMIRRLIEANCSARFKQKNTRSAKLISAIGRLFAKSWKNSATRAGRSISSLARSSCPPNPVRFTTPAHPALCVCAIKKNGSSRKAKNRHESNELYRINRPSGGSNSQLSLE